MNRTIIFILLVSFPILVQCQQKKLQLDTLRNQMSIVSEYTGESNKTIRILEQRIDQANDTISNQGAIISSFEVIYSILTIVFTIIGLLVPIVTYYYGIKPSRDQIKNLEANFDKRLEQYLTTSRHENIDKAISGLTSNSAELKQSSLTYLSLTQHEGLTDLQYFRLYKVLASEGIDSVQKHSLANILTGKENEYATEYCVSILRSKSPYNEYIPARYFGMIGIKKFIPNFVEYLQTINDKSDAFTRIISHMKIVSLDSVLDLLNSDEIIVLFNKSDSSIFKNNTFTNGFEKGYEENKLKDTKFYKLVFG